MEGRRAKNRGSAIGRAGPSRPFGLELRNGAAISAEDDRRKWHRSRIFAAFDPRAERAAGKENAPSFYGNFSLRRIECSLSILPSFFSSSSALATRENRNAHGF